jgi:MipA family protein
MFRICLFLLGLLATSAPALAQGRPESGPPQYIALGIGTNSKFPGASDYKIIPFGGARINVPGGALLVQGPGLTYSVKVTGGLDAGPLFQINGSRKADTGDALVNLLTPVDTSLEVGGFVKYSFPGIGGRANQFDVGITATQDVLDGHGGFRVAVSAGHSWRWRSGMFVQLGLSASHASAKYMTRFYGVTAGGGLATGLPIYQPKAGFENVSVSTIFNVPVDGPWSLFGRVAYSRLIGKAADSPIVQRRGSADQVFAGIALAYQF